METVLSYGYTSREPFGVAAQAALVVGVLISSALGGKFFFANRHIVHLVARTGGFFTRRETNDRRITFAFVVSCVGMFTGPFAVFAVVVAALAAKHFQKQTPTMYGFELSRVAALNAAIIVVIASYFAVFVLVFVVNTP